MKCKKLATIALGKKYVARVPKYNNNVQNQLHCQDLRRNFTAIFETKHNGEKVRRSWVISWISAPPVTGVEQCIF